MEFSIYLKNILYEKGNVLTPLGIEPRAFRFLVECSIISATDKITLFSNKISFGEKESTPLLSEICHLWHVIGILLAFL